MSIGETNRQFNTDVALSDWHKILQTVAPEYQFLDSHWYEVWGQSYAANDSDISIINYAATALSDNSTMGIFPCALRSRAGIRILSMAGYYYPFRTFLCPPEDESDSIDRFATSIVEQSGVTMVHLGPLQTNSSISRQIESSFIRQGWTLCKVDAGAQQMVELPDTIDVFRASLSRSLRKNHDRRKRQLQELGELELRHYNACTIDQWRTAIEHCSVVEANSWLMDDVTGATRVYQQEAFWQQYVSDREASRRLSVWVVYLNDTPIAYSLALDAGGCRYSISGQYDKDYSKHGVGIIADMAMFTHAIEKGFSVVNMGDGEAEYKKRWGASSGSELQTWYLFKPGLLGKLLFTAFKVANWLKSTGVFKRFNRIV